MSFGVDDSVLDDDLQLNTNGKSHEDIIKEVEVRVDKNFTYLFFKRVFDLFTAFIMLIVMFPFFLVIALAIKLDSKGNIIFGHSRIGEDNKIIKVYKFRTMVNNSAEVFENFTPEQKAEFERNFKLDNDPRITRVGGFLRKTSLDELPQLINIVKGDLSLVGPRPIVKKEIEKYGVYSGKLFSVKPGLTGYWQANGRSDTTYDERIKMDMFYINNRSALLDIKILLKTFAAVFKREGAV